MIIYYLPKIEFRTTILGPIFHFCFSSKTKKYFLDSLESGIPGRKRLSESFSGKSWNFSEKNRFRKF